MAQRRSKKILLATASAATVFAVVGCSGGSESTSSAVATDFDGVSLTVWSSIPYDPYDTLQRGYFETCAEDLGITVEVETVASDYSTKLLQAASSSSLPDIALLSTDNDLPTLAAEGVLTDLSDYGLTTDGMEDSVSVLGEYDDTLVGLPVQVENYAIFYNKTMFEDAGITEFPTTFDGLVEAAKTLTTDDVYGAAFSGADDGSTPLYFLSFLLSAGGDPADPTGDGAVAAVDLYKQLVDEGAMSPEFVNWGWDAPDQWDAGTAAMTVSGPWNLVDPPEGIDYGVAAFPTATDSDTSTVNLLGYAYGIPVQSDTTKMAAAAALIECRASEENQVEVALQGGYIPALTAAQEEFVAQVPEAETFVDAVSNSYNPAVLGTDWATLQSVYTAAIQDVGVNGTSAADALATASQ
ncbi:MAG: extracellular solute-binding protein [Microbacterium sp.]